jgi:hypothetical protein
MSTSHPISRSHWLRFAIGMALYAVLVLLQSAFLEPRALPLWAMIPVALIPIVPAVWAMVVLVQAVRLMDELQRRIHVEASVYALGATALLTFGYGFLEVYAEFPRLSMFFVWPLIAFTYWGGGALARRAYR